MSNELKKYFCPRLIDFVIIVGCKEPASPAQLMTKHLHQLQLQYEHYEKSLPPEMRHKDGTSGYQKKTAEQQRSEPPIAQMPELLRRYPLDDHEDFMLPQDVTYFCQPEGCSNINCKSQMRANANRDTTSFIFTLTEKDSARCRYGVCINFFRPVEKKQKTTSNNSDSKSRSSKNNSDTDEDDHRQNSDIYAKKSINKKRRNKKVKYTHTLTSLCIISHHPFFSIFRECLNILRRIIEACHARSLASVKSQFNNNQNSNQLIGKDTVWGILTGSSNTLSTEQISALVACEIKEIETWILRLLSAPVPIPGRTKLIVNYILRFKIFLLFFILYIISKRLTSYQMSRQCYSLYQIILDLISSTFRYIYHWNFLVLIFVLKFTL
jgi:hypothetical protein